MNRTHLGDFPVGGVYFGGGVYDPRASLRRDHTDEIPEDDGVLEGECQRCGMDDVLSDDGLCQGCLHAEDAAAETLRATAQTLDHYTDRARRALMEYQRIARALVAAATGREVQTYEYLRGLAEGCVRTLDRMDAYRADPNYSPPATPAWFPTDEELERWR